MPQYMRNPVFRVLFVVFLAAALLAGAGVATTGDVASTASSESPQTLTASDPGLTAAVAPAGIEPISTGSPARTSEQHRVDPASSTDRIHAPESALQREPFTQVDTTFEAATTTQIRLDLQPNRDAEWEVTVRYEFTDENQTVPFEAVGDRFLDGELGPDPDLFEGFAAEASRNVDRQMTITDVDRDVVLIEDPAEMDLDDDIDRDEDPVAVGELQLTFVWTEFLEEDGETLRLGDALTTQNDGTWVRSLEPGQRIEVLTPEGYTVSGTPGAAVPLQDNAVIVEGPRVFEGDERVVVVYSPTAGSGSLTPPWTMLAGAIVLAALLIAVGLVGYRRIGSPNGDGGTDAPSATGDAASNGTHPPESTAGGPAADPDDPSEPEDEADLSLLSDEERVERLLERNGGRMRQADIVAETGWSDAKVSQLLSAMADEGRVEKLRLGRENLISLPDDTERDETVGTDGDGGTN